MDIRFGRKAVNLRKRGVNISIPLLRQGESKNRFLTSSNEQRVYVDTYSESVIR